MEQYLSQPIQFQILLDDFENTIRKYGLWGGMLDGASAFTYRKPTSLSISRHWRAFSYAPTSTNKTPKRFTVAFAKIRLQWSLFYFLILLIALASFNKCVEVFISNSD